MKKPKYCLRGEGFTLEEVDELLRNQEPLEPMTEEEREKLSVQLRESAVRMKADMAALEASNGVRVTREDLEREMKRQQADSAPSETKAE